MLTKAFLSPNPLKLLTTKVFRKKALMERNPESVGNPAGETPIGRPVVAEAVSLETPEEANAAVGAAETDLQGRGAIKAIKTPSSGLKRTSPRASRKSPGTSLRARLNWVTREGSPTST